MKLFLIIIMLVFGVSNVTAQLIGLQYYSTGAGRNITATYSKKLNKGLIGVGIGVNINQIKQPDNEGHIYYKRLFATQPIHYLNVNFFVQRDVFSLLKKLDAFIFYDLQVKYSPTRTTFYEHDVKNLGPFTWVENGFGLGFTVDITERVCFQQKFGGGIHLVFGDEPSLVKYNRPVWEFMYLYNIGINYKIKKTINKN